MLILRGLLTRPSSLLETPGTPPQALAVSFRNFLAAVFAQVPLPGLLRTSAEAARLRDLEAQAEAARAEHARLQALLDARERALAEQEEELKRVLGAAAAAAVAAAQAGAPAFQTGGVRAMSADGARWPRACPCVHADIVLHFNTLVCLFVMTLQEIVASLSHHLHISASLTLIRSA